MPSKRLTDITVARITPPPQGKQVDYYDAGMPGLVLRINYGGKKTWRALYYVKGTDPKTGKSRTEPRTHALGRYPVMSLKQARDAARKFLEDPQKALAHVATGSFRDIAASFIKRHVEANGLRSQKEIERCLHTYVLPHWQDRVFTELRRSDVTDLLDRIEDERGARQAEMCLAIIRKMMNWYASRHDDYVVPVVRGMQRVKAGDRARKRILDDDEIRAVWKACDDAGTFGALVRVLLLTAQRRDKVATMAWDDLKGDEWHISTVQREKSNAGMLRLPGIVLDIINRQPRIAGNPYVFAGRGPGPLNSFSEGKQELDAKAPMPRWVIHDLRRTARSLLSRAGVRPDIAERVLGHAIGGVEGIYDRHHYDDEKAEALVKLAALVERILNPQDNVVPLRAG